MSARDPRPRVALPLGYALALAGAEHVAAMPELERRAATLFAPYGLARHVLEDVTEIEAVRRSQREGRYLALTCVADELVGYALLDVLDGEAHLDELGVHPEHGRRGLGAALVEASCDWGRQRDASTITLTTYRDIPFNAPWYESLGFAVVDERDCGPELRERIAEQLAQGLVPPARVAMRRSL